jgi:hypothetical protein
MTMRTVKMRRMTKKTTLKGRMRRLLLRQQVQKRSIRMNRMKKK